MDNVPYECLDFELDYTREETNEVNSRLRVFQDECRADIEIRQTLAGKIDCLSYNSNSNSNSNSSLSSAPFLSVVFRCPFNPQRHIATSVFIRFYIMHHGNKLTPY